MSSLFSMSSSIFKTAFQLFKAKPSLLLIFDAAQTLVSSFLFQGQERARTHLEQNKTFLSVYHFTRTGYVA